MSTTVTIAGEQQSVGNFSAFKAMLVMDIIADAEKVYREILQEAAAFKIDYERANVVEFDRATARREFAPRVLFKVVREEKDDGRIEVHQEPVLDEQTGEPKLGPDPLGHLTEEDWTASGNVLRIFESPSDEVVYAATLPRAFKMARDEMLSLLAIVTSSNADLERWDNDDDVDQQLEDTEKRLLHRASQSELVSLAAAALRVCREEIRGPFDELVEEIRTTFRRQTPETSETPVPATDPQATDETIEPEPISTIEPEPMQVETLGSPSSSTSSEADTDGTPQSSSIEPASAGSPS